MEEMRSLEERMNVLITDNSHLECQVQASKNEVNEKESLVQTLTQNLEGKKTERS
ncbi:Hypothetical protein FKW44_019451 [Caligus rogercresseyi]|uniref:Uncharacterized protein n=1 Tax=Caligus rogercresseyi TaxID=217165 RepID=A0A7T8GVU3_CALRO|nr:Hypothetical protein FKW44_019451 [Caligus rogercresseyi]